MIPVSSGVFYHCRKKWNGFSREKNLLGALIQEIWPLYGYCVTFCIHVYFLIQSHIQRQKQCELFFFLRWLNYIIFAFVAEVRLTLCNSFIVFVFLLNFLFCIGVQPVNNVVMVSGEQRRDSAIHTHVCILPQLPSHPGCHVTLSRVPCWLSF